MKDKQDTTEVRIKGKLFHFEVDFDNEDGIKTVRLTECGDSNKIDMLEAYDLSVPVPERHGA